MQGTLDLIILKALSLEPMHGWGIVARMLTRASGQVPVVLVVDGPCLGGPALLLGLADVVILTDDAVAYVSEPAAVARITRLVPAVPKTVSAMKNSLPR